MKMLGYEGAEDAWVRHMDMGILLQEEEQTTERIVKSLT